jgi:uncharacterized protein YbjT (DUF2867 family)
MEYWTSVANQHSEIWHTPEQPVRPPGPEAAEALAAAYWESLERSLKGVVRSEGSTLGPIQLRVARTGVSILEFDAASIEQIEGGIEIVFPIVGGAACSGPAGALRLIGRVEGPTVRLGVVVDGYRPRFERLRLVTFPIAAPYTLTQHLVHSWVTRRSLPRMARAIAPPLPVPSIDVSERLRDLSVGVVGASGYVGRRLIPELRDQGARVRAIVRRPNADLERVRDIEIAYADALDADALRLAFEGLDVVYWLVHSMGSGGDFAELDRRAARNAAEAAEAAGVRQIIYLGGLGDDEPALSHHLQSRHETGTILAESGSVPVTTLRAAMVIGQHSASFQMLRDLVHRLPAMVTPRWVTTRSQPIAFADLRDYLIGVCDLPEAFGRTLDVGGPDILTFQEMMERTAGLAGRRKPVILPVPVLSPQLSSLWCGLITDVDTNIARPLVEGLRNETVCRNDDILTLVPKERLSFDEAVRRALEGVPLRY